jgi:hypothetical protein
LIQHEEILYINFDEGIRSGLSDRTLKSWQDPVKVKLDGYANKWINIGLLAPKYQLLIKEVLCKGMDPKEYYLKEQLVNWLPALPNKDKELLQLHSIQRQAVDYGTGEISDKRLSGLPLEVINLYILQARWLMLLRDGYKMYKKELKALNIHTNEAYVAMVLQIGTSKGVKLWSVKSIRNVLAKFNKNGITSLISGKYGNENTVKVDDMILQWLIEYYSDSKKPEIPMVTNWINASAVQNGWKGFPITEGAVYNNLYKPDVMPVWYMARHGFGAWKNKYQYTMLRYEPSVPHALWIGDDTKVNLFYQTPSGVVAQLQVYAIFDACTRCWIGWSFAINKQGKDVSSETVKEAYRMAVERTGVTPYQMQYDNDKANVFYKKLNTLNFPCMPNNGQSKLIEKGFDSLQRRVMRHDDASTGQNIQSVSLQSKINTDSVKPLASVEAAMREQEVYFEIWNATVPKGKDASPKQRILDADVSECAKLTRYDHMEGISMTHNLKTITYEVRKDELPDLAFLEGNVGRRFKIRYNPKDLQCVGLYTNDERFVAWAMDVKRMPTAVLDYTENSKKDINARLELKKVQKANNKARLQMASDVANAEDVYNVGHVFVEKELRNAAEAAVYESMLATKVPATEKTVVISMEDERRARARRG